MSTAGIAIFGLTFFLGAIILVEYLDRRFLNPARTWISSYITDAPLSWLEDLGFVGLAGSMELMPHVFNSGPVQSVALSAGGIAALLVVASRKYFPAIFPGVAPATITRIHVISAGIAFLTAFTGILIGSGFLPRLVLAVTLLACFWIMDFRVHFRDQAIEKVLAIGICIAGLVRLIPLR